MAYEEASAGMRDAIQAAIDERCERQELPRGTLIRYVVVYECMGPDDGRVLSWAARSFDGTGLYPWESLGMLTYVMGMMTAEIGEEDNG